MRFARLLLCSLAAVAVVAVGVMPAAADQARDAEAPPVVHRPAPPAPAPAQRPWSFDVYLGLSTPYGLLAVSRDFELGARGDVAVGARVTGGLGYGLELGLMPYVRLGSLPGVELRASAGLVAGGHLWREQAGWCFDESCATKKSLFTMRSAGELSLRAESEHGWHVAPYVGVSTVLNPGALECAGSDEAIAHCRADHADDGVVSWYGGLALGTSW